MRLGIIDVGTNSVKFDIYQIDSGRAAHRLYREKLMIRLGQGVFLSHRLDPDARRKATQAFASFKRTFEDFQVDRVVAFGTSALRAATDSSSLVKDIRRSTGIDVRVISGEEEARLIARGVLANKPKLKGRFALVDIGGGSSEISVCRKGKIANFASFNLGAARLQQIFLKKSPPQRPVGGGPHPVDALRGHIRNLLDATIKKRDWPSADRILGSGGTIRALVKIAQKTSGQKTVTSAGLKKFIKEISRMSAAQLLRVPGMEASRADMILAGAILLQEIMDALRADKAQAIPFTLRDGILDKELSSARSFGKSSSGFDVEDVSLKARRLGVHEEHIAKVKMVGDRLFRKFQKLHRLGAEWKKYLLTAGIIHPAGKSISNANHDQHSYYIAKNADIPLMVEWENEFIAQLCLWRKAGKMDDVSLPDMSDQRKNAFFKLLSILKIIDALDRRNGPLVSVDRVSVRPREVILDISAPRGDTTLELLRLEQKKDLFEDVYKKRLTGRGARGKSLRK